MPIPPWQFSRAYTPELIKRLVQITCAVTLIAVALDPYIGLQGYLALSPLFYERYFLWQIVTSMFLIPSAIFSFGFLLDVTFAMLVLWLFGSLLLERIGKRQFLTLYLSTGILSGIVALCIMKFVGLYYMVSTCLPVLLAVTTLWTMSDPYQEILLFFVLPLKARWVLVFALLGTIFVNFVQHDLVMCGAYTTAFLFSYLYGLLVLGFRSPFDWMTGLDRLINRSRLKLQKLWNWHLLGPNPKDDAFMDATLEKISKSGTSSLSLYERLRLKWISLKKRLR